MLQIVCIDARLQLDGYIVSPSTCMKQGIGNDSSDRNFNFQQEVVIPTQLLVKETIGVGVNEKAALSSDKNCPFVYINFDFTLVNKVASL